MFFNAIANALRPLFLKYQKSEFGVMLLPRFVPSLGKLGSARWRVGEKPVFSRRRLSIPHLLLGWGRRDNGGGPKESRVAGDRKI